MWYALAGGLLMSLTLHSPPPPTVVIRGEGEPVEIDCVMPVVPGPSVPVSMPVARPDSTRHYTMRVVYVRCKSR